MPLGKREKQWLRPISEAGGGDVSIRIQEQEQQEQQEQQQQEEEAKRQQQVEQVKRLIANQQQQMDGGTLDIASELISTLNGNPYFIGMLMLLLNLGGRFISMELTPKQEEFLQQRWLRPLLFFTVIFIATRNLAVAFWMTLALFLILWILANEQSPFCIVPSWRTTGLDPQQKEHQYEQNMDVIESIFKANAPASAAAAH